MNQRILDIIKSPQDLKLLTDEELSVLAREVREEIITVCARTGGHVASSLGAVEIILAAHAVLDSPRDKLLFDVGHQAYTHKLVTGRLESFSTLRSYGGISGFPKPDESPHDVFSSGHASDSLSVALGLAKARELRGSDEKIVAVIGDASLSGGMAFEALNQIGHEQIPLLIILNDNEMSISRNVGALMMHLGNMRTSARYRNRRDNLQELIENRGRIGRGIVDLGRNMKESIKQFLIPQSMIFEQLGIICTPPIDGHDIGAVKEMLALMLESDVPVLVHAVTKKGAGYEPAERNPELFHGIGSFDIETGEPTSNPGVAPTYTSVFSQALLDEAAQDEHIVAITAAMTEGTGLTPFAEAFPERFIDAGIAEEHVVGFASGLARGGKKPVVAMYSTFTQRAFDQTIINIALDRVGVVFCLDRAGLVGDDGPTHHGIFDLAYMRMIPNMRVLAPSNEAELVNSLHTALALGGPFAIRYPRGSAEGVAFPDTLETFEIGRARLLREGRDVSILAFGRLVSQALRAAEVLAEEGVEASVVDMRWVKPLDVEAIRVAAAAPLLVTVEEGVVTGGAGEGVLKELSNLNLPAGSYPKTLVLGISDRFVLQGNMDVLLRDLFLDGEGIASKIRSALS